jgi:hypothetical protein
MGGDILDIADDYRRDTRREMTSRKVTTQPSMVDMHLSIPLIITKECRRLVYADTY